MNNDSPTTRETQQPDGRNDKTKNPKAVPESAKASAHPNNTNKYKDTAKRYFKNAVKWLMCKAWPLTKKIGRFVFNPKFWIPAATVFIAVSTGIYTYYARQQWDSMNGQLALQKTVAKLTIGAPFVNWNWTGAYYSKKNSDIFIQVAVQNDGKTPANSISIAVDWGFSDKVPAAFSSENYLLMNPSSISAMPTSGVVPGPGQDAVNRAHCCSQQLIRPITPQEYSADQRRIFYVWGIIRYRDFTDTLNYQTFCRYAPGVSVLNVKPSYDAGGGFDSPWNDCKK